MHLAFCLQLIAIEIALRGAAFYLAHPRALGYLAASVALLHLSASRSSRKPARAAVALLLGCGITAQAAFFRYYHAPLDDQAALAARLAWADVRPMMIHALPTLLGGAALIAAIEFAWLSRLSRSRLSRPRPRLAALVLAIGIAAGGPLRHSTTEIRTAYAATAFALAPASAPPKGAGHAALPPLFSHRARVPNILLIVTESVRASSFCGDAAEPCPMSPEVHALLPDRIPLLQMRVASSYTALSMSVLFTGLPQLGRREPIAAAPDLFDIARATRALGRPVGVHYWSSQSPSFFERSDAASAVDSFLSADTFLGHVTDDIGEAVTGGLDRKVAEECRQRFAGLASPYFVMVHLSGTHAPYFFDPDNAPFRPFGRTVNWAGMPDLYRSYKNSIIEQDHSIAACARAFLDAQRGGPSLLFFTSDHGESFGERDAIHHGQNLYDEQIHVPAFVVASPGALEPEEERALAAARGEFLTHFDVLPTLLDALGVLDHFAIAKDRARMPGRSLLRPRPAAAAPLPVTNCSEMWQCPLNTWGVFAGDRKLVAQAWDGAWRCMSLRGGEHEEALDRCEDLVKASRDFFATKPNGAPND
jgi:hypothetical protein